VTITHWHRGKLILLWAWGAVLALLALVGVGAVDRNSRVGLLLGLGLLIFAIALQVVLSVLTWLWLGGREDPGQRR